MPQANKATAHKAWSIGCPATPPGDSLGPLPFRVFTCCELTCRGLWASPRGPTSRPPARFSLLKTNT